ncbi:hypothetical protein N2599_30845 (plasmid) [Rhizobium sullae]|uniref:Uncharacterized protein n=1 Tax=Rhizobium sullae TaxID=50338 RepID=A0ABY5XRC9_RHISU|nr:hypothetical protein [Rhizobium sullae]UWU17179.1 hypothetical protein N2599_30845 [Rhizobium sullae]
MIFEDAMHRIPAVTSATILPSEVVTGCGLVCGIRRAIVGLAAAIILSPYASALSSIID